MVASLSTGAGSSLFGRTAEQTVLRAGLDAARAGRGRLVFVAGEAGIGKTAPVTALARDAAQEGARVLVGRCEDVVPPPPYGLWRDLFAGAEAAALPVPPPAAFAPLTAAPATTDPAPPEAQVRAWLTALARTRPAAPVVLVLEDLHWADRLARPAARPRPRRRSGTSAHPWHVPRG